MIDLNQIILDGTKYVSGFANTEDNYVISASMVGKDPLQNYLSILHGTIDNDKISDNTLGTILHKGMEQLIVPQIANEDDTQVFIEHNMVMILANGWILSGTADLMYANPGMPLTIRDYKFTKAYALKMFKQNPSAHQYSKQLSVLDLLAVKNHLHEPGEPDANELICDFFLKDANAMKSEITHNPQMVVPTIDHATLEEQIVEETNILQAYIEAGEIPPRCEDVWERNVSGKIIPSRCAYWCSYNKVCPHYSASTQQTAARLSNW